MPVRLATNAMGTRFEVLLDGGPEPFLRAVGEEALREIEAWHRRLSLFEPASLVSRINREAAAAPVRLDPETFALLSLCERVHRDSSGLFDITIDPLMRAWGMRPGDRADTGPIGMHLLRLDAQARTIAFEAPGLRIDLGAIAKGFALDLAAAIVRQYNVPRALIHGGTSSVVAIGAPPGRDAWLVGIRSDGTPATVALRDAALGVSAPRGRSGEHDGLTGGHIMDPRAGAPAAGADTAAVVGPSAALADAWSTALIAGGGRGPRPPREYSVLVHSAPRGWTIDDPAAALVGRGDALEVA